MRLIVLLLIGLVAAGCDRQKTEAPQAPAAEAESGKGLDRNQQGKAAPITSFKNPDGGDASLASFKGTPVLVNLWATWCAPCVKELPTLDALSRRAGAPRVIAVSQDIAPRASVEAFLDRHKVTDLEAWHDPAMSLSGALGAEVLPTTIYYDARGRELWRYVGDLDWTGAEAARLLGEASRIAAAN